MKKHYLVGFLVAGFAVVMARRATPASSQCESIRNSDDRHYCRGVTQRKPIYCESIRDSDKRHLCRAVAGEKHIACESIRDADTRALCRATVRRK